MTGGQTDIDILSTKTLNLTADKEDVCIEAFTIIFN